MRFMVLAALCLSILFAEDKAKPAVDKVALEAYLRHLLAVIPEVQMKIEDPKPGPVPSLLQLDVELSYGGRGQTETFYMTKDGKDIIRGYIYNLSQNPFKEDLDKLKPGLAPSIGTAGAPVVLIVFSDFECPNCREEAKILRQNLTSAYPKDVRLYFKDFPLEQIHPWAKPAAVAGQCVFRQNPQAFWQYHDWIYDHQTEITAENLKSKVLEFAQGAKDLDGMQLGRCMDTKATEADVEASIAMGKSLKIDATPTMFLNGRRLVGAYPWQNLQQLIDGELHYQKTAQNAGEKCCEVKVPSPLNK